MSEDLISRQVAIDEMQEYWRSLNLRRRRIPLAAEAVYMDLKGVVATLPSANPERKTGQWLPSRDRDYNECSCCHRITEPAVVAYKFCPYCGAEMTN